MFALHHSVVSFADLSVISVQPKPFPLLQLNELLNWPYISVNVSFLDIAFRRRNVHQSNIYVSSTMDFPDIQENGDRICYIKKGKNPLDNVSVFTYDFLVAYLKEIVDIMVCFYLW